MRLYLYAFGKIRTSGLRETADYYKKLIRPWTPLEEIELKPLEVPDKSAATRLRIQQEEGKLLLSKLSKREGNKSSPQGLFYLLDERGSNWPTRQWVKTIQSWELQSVPSVALCIGSSLGFSEEVRSKMAGSISFGAQTLPHELARVVLTEQLYRAYSVHKGHPYHNES